jgi:hypothetical protein
MPLIDAIRYHHDVKPTINDQHLLMIIHVADIIVNTYTPDSKDRMELSGVHPDALSALGNLLDTISDWYPDSQLEIESACNFFLEDSAK